LEFTAYGPAQSSLRSVEVVAVFMFGPGPQCMPFRVLVVQIVLWFSSPAGAPTANKDASLPRVARAWCVAHHRRELKETHWAIGIKIGADVRRRINSTGASFQY